MNFSDKAKSVISAVAPLIGTAIGGPFGALAGTFLGKILGPQGGDDKAVEAAIATGDPEILLRLKQANNDFQAHMTELGISEEKLGYDDIANARAREVAVRDQTPRNLAYALVGGTLVLITCVMMGWAKAESVTAGTMIGYLISECKSALQYYFGTTIGSKDKDATLATIAKMP